MTSFSDQPVHRFLAVWCTFGMTLPWLFDEQCCYSTDPPWVSGVIILPLFQRRSRWWQEWLLSNWGILLLDVIMNIAVIIYSQYLSRWRHSGLRLFLKGIAPDLPKCVYVCVNHSRSSFTSESSEYTFCFYESLQIAFPNNVLVIQFHDECG